MPELTGEPAYRQVANDLRRQIMSGTLPAGAQLPSTAALTQTYEVSATVIKAALNELRVDGLIVGQQGKGTFVRDRSKAAPEDHSELDEITAHIKALRDDLRQVNERLASLEEQIQERQDES